MISPLKKSVCMLTYFIDFISQPKEILKCLRLVVGVAKQGRRVESSHHKHAVFFNKFAVLLRNLEIGTDEPLCGNPSDANNDFRSHKSDLLPKPCDAGVLLLGLWVAIVRRSALNHVSYVNILFPIQAYCVKVFIQKLAAPADKGFTLEILLFARTFTDEKHFCTFISDAENEIGSRCTEFAFITTVAFQLVYISALLCVVFYLTGKLIE